MSVFSSRFIVTLDFALLWELGNHQHDCFFFLYVFMQGNEHRQSGSVVPRVVFWELLRKKHRLDAVLFFNMSIFISLKHMQKVPCSHCIYFSLASALERPYPLQRANPIFEGTVQFEGPDWPESRLWNPCFAWVYTFWKRISQKPIPLGSRFRKCFWAAKCFASSLVYMP